MIKKKIFFPVLAVAIITAAVAGSSFVSAQDTTGPDSLISRIAQKFNLNENEVKAVFDEEKTQKEVEMKAQLEKKLNQAVSDGKITEAQRQAIAAKFGTPFTIKFEKGKMTHEQMKTFHEKKQAEMDQWLKDNNLTKETLSEILGHGKGGFPGKRVFMMPPGQ